jgi:hypothetical protein
MGLGSAEMVPGERLYRFKPQNGKTDAACAYSNSELLLVCEDLLLYLVAGKVHPGKHHLVTVTCSQSRPHAGRYKTGRFEPHTPSLTFKPWFLLGSCSLLRHVRLCWLPQHCVARMLQRRSERCRLKLRFTRPRRHLICGAPTSPPSR